MHKESLSSLEIGQNPHEGDPKKIKKILTLEVHLRNAEKVCAQVQESREQVSETLRQAYLDSVFHFAQKIIRKLKDKDIQSFQVEDYKGGKSIIIYTKIKRNIRPKAYSDLKTRVQIQSYKSPNGLMIIINAPNSFFEVAPKV